MSAEHFDVLIIGAGLSGIGAGYHLQTRSPRKSYAILEGRAALGGTWDLFRYPGIRSDSDMFTLGYSFRFWREAKAIADGPSILKYLSETAREFGIDRRIRFQHRVRTASWCSQEARWTIEAEVGDDKQSQRYTCNFLYLCSGYYDYDSGYAPQFPGSDTFEGRLIHPQQWPQALDYRNRKIVVIGSGATAVTLAPALAEQAAHVTLLQRSPTYIVSLPTVDRIAGVIRRLFPEFVAHRMIRCKNILLGALFFQLCRRAPDFAKRLLRRHVVRELPAGFDVDTHFKPRYAPWDQRICVVPNSDLFHAITAGRVSIVTDEIANLTRGGIRLESGKELPADIIVTATGLRLLAFGGIELSVDGSPVEPGRTLAYKSLMLSNVPNCAICVGYTNASWTLRADLSSKYVCRLINYMERFGYKQCVPRNDDPTLRPKSLLGLNSGYVQRGIDRFPKQGSKRPWVVRQNYLVDLIATEFGAIDDGTMVFS
jgi:cation diffusion facilitator CzcD-associated flavoprotein CzcO